MEDLNVWEGINIIGMTFGSFVPAYVQMGREQSGLKQRPYVCSCVDCGHWAVFRGAYLIGKRPTCKACDGGVTNAV